MAAGIHNRIFLEVHDNGRRTQITTHFPYDRLEEDNFSVKSRFIFLFGILAWWWYHCDKAAFSCSCYINILYVVVVRLI